MATVDPTPEREAAPPVREKASTFSVLLSALGKKDERYSKVLAAKDDDAAQDRNEERQMYRFIIKGLGGLVLLCIILLGVIAGAVAGGKIQFAGSEVELGSSD